MKQTKQTEKGILLARILSCANLNLLNKSKKGARN